MIQLLQTKNDTVTLLYDAESENIEVGQYLSVLEKPKKDSGVLVQVIATELVHFDGLLQSAIQRVLEAGFASTTTPVQHEVTQSGMDLTCSP